MGTVSSINESTEEWERFFDYIYGDESGYVYSPTKDPESGSFQKYHFQWPQEKAAFFRHLAIHSKDREVYYGPALFASRGAEKPDFKGTYFVWCEFDGNAPDAVVDIPEPTLKIQSSQKGHEHWYWKIDGFINDIQVAESISQKLAYYLGADLGSWNGNRVLRPVGTIHHESGLPVKILRWDERPRSIADFVSLPELPIKILQEDDIKVIPFVLDVIAKYKWDKEVFDFFKEPTMPKGSRSSALSKLGHYCIEMGMTNAETLSIISSADDRWGKFKNRTNRKKCLIDLINSCRAKHAVDPIEEETDVDDGFKVYTFAEFQNTDFKLEWLVPNFLHKKGLFIVAGPPGVGKSQLTMRAAESFARGQDVLGWKAERPLRSLFVSMEMPAEEVKYFMDVMRMEDADGMLTENFRIMPLGRSVGLTTKEGRSKLDKVMDQHRPDIIMLDSLGIAISDELSSDKVILDAFNYVNKQLRNEYESAVWFIHHPRKEQIGNKKPNKLDDLYGNRYITAAATSAINMWPVGDEIEVSCLKMRMTPEFKPFRIKRESGIRFKRTGARIGRDTKIFNSEDEFSSEGLADSI